LEWGCDSCLGQTYAPFRRETMTNVIERFGTS
jgi:hypothetical protein